MAKKKWIKGHWTKPKRRYSRSSDNQKSRLLLTIIAIFSVLSLVLVFWLWWDITPKDIVEPFITGIEVTNTSTIYVEDTIAEVWNTRYQSDNAEFLYCLYGQEYQDGWLINEIKTTEVVYATEELVQYQQCTRNNKYLGTIHSHPYLKTNPRAIPSCKMSKQDIYTFGAERQPLTGIVCGEDKFAFYGVEDLERSYEVIVVSIEPEVN